MNLQTFVKIPYNELSLKTSSYTIFLGSCFAENIGIKMKEAMEPNHVCINPFGVLYNPFSILSALQILLHGSLFFPDNFIFKDNNNFWHSWMHSTLFSSNCYDNCKEKIMSAYNKATRQLSKTQLLCITFGTTHSYLHKELGIIVSNCHKQPQNLFLEKIHSIEDIIHQYSQIIEDIHLKYPQLHVIFTISPYRYLKYGLHENQIAKATLLLAVEELSKKYNFVHYFPAYELFMDELRDYRFYAEDMIHPSQQGINYIWEKWLSFCFSIEDQNLLLKNIKVNKKNKHRPLIDANF